MKVATIIAKFASGWRTLAAGEDVAAIRARFKAVKVAGVLVEGSEAAEVALYFDTAGEIMRKFLRTPEAIAARDAADVATAEQQAQAEQRAADAAAAADGRAQAVAIAQKAVAVVAAEVAGLASLPPAAASVAAPAPVAEVAAEASGIGSEQAEDDEGDPATRFGGKGAKSSAKRR